MAKQAHLAKRCPSGVFSSPACVVEDNRLDRDEKIDLLERWAYDELELDVAESEGMGGGERSRLTEVRRALHRVERNPSDESARH